ncbi:MAG: hypothetical protein LBQ09_08105 [Acidobacteriaceae bacterium]|nr:hypothetical protein [Acidobacteriaceae bacterium]
MHAYLAAGQSTTFWGPQVSSAIQDASSALDTLRSLATTDAARQSLLDTSAALTELANIDSRAREYVSTHDTLMASDIVFSDGSQAAADAARDVDATRTTEHQEYEFVEASIRRREAYAAGGAALFSVLVLLSLACAPAPQIVTPAIVDAEPVNDVPPHEASRPVADTPAPATALATPDASLLQATAELCTAFGRLHDAAELKALLASASRVIDATGLVVWLGDPSGADLQPVIAHGYSDEVVRRMKAVPRSADNAAAAAYRTGTLQIVPATATRALGAIVAPILSADGCIGALTAETRAGAERADSSHALVSIVAAQLSNVLAGSVHTESSPARVASA